ncbi:MAG: helix-turn-helix domain-containing protein [Candidatus Marinimicrobia bacterium]|nr:helix-turn-helix domain-containing protein [Candidatus Neomarinimicrobiota bacterium]
MPLQRHYSIATLAKLFDLSADFWRKKIKSGEIKAVRLGTAVRIPEGEVRKLAQNIRSISDTVEEILSESR